MLREINETVASVCEATSVTAKALTDGAKILRIKGAAAKQTAALEAVAAIEAAKKDLTQQQLQAAIELLTLIDD